MTLTGTPSAFPDSRTPGGLEITSEEMERFKDSMKNDEFKKLFFDYMNEISDPNNKKLYEEELAKVEAEKGWKVRYVKPQPHYCLKTWIASAPPQANDRGNPIQTFPQKCFVNICSSSEINVPAESSSVPGKWDIPYSVANGRTDVDHELKECKVYDVVFHPQALEKSHLLPAFKTLLSKTALEGLSRQFSIVFDKTKGYKVLVNMKSKGAPLMTMIREKDETASTTTGEEKETSLDFIQKLASTISSPKPSRSTSSTPLHAQTSKAAESPMPKPERLTIPDFKIIHQHKFNDYQKFAGSSGHEVRQDFASRPDALVIKISLPGVASAALVDVDFTPDGLGLDLLVPELYKLHLDLPFPVLDEESKAKFDKKSRTLNIEVPVVPAPIVEMPAPVDDVPIERDEEKEPEKEESNEELKGSDLVSEITKDIQSLRVLQEESVDEKDAVEQLASTLDSTTLLENTVQLQVYHTLPPFEASQSPGSISFIIPVSGINDSSLVKVRHQHDITTPPSIASSIKLDFTAGSDKGKDSRGVSYTLHLGFHCDFLEFEVSVTSVNLCLLIIKKEDVMWKQICVGSSCASKKEAVEWQKRVLVLPETIPELDQQITADCAVAVEAKQKKDLVVIDATLTSFSKPPSSSTSVPAADTGTAAVKKPVFVNSALFDLDD